MTGRHNTAEPQTLPRFFSLQIKWNLKMFRKNKKGNWTLSAILGVVGAGLIVLPFLVDLSKWFILLGIIFILLAFLANK